jgi:superfamily II DNA or RNA helicase
MLSEANTRKEMIDTKLNFAGWDVNNLAQVSQEFDIVVPLSEGVSEPRTPYEGHQFSDYVLIGRDGKPLAVVEAKKALKDAAIGREQAKQYCYNIQKQHGGKLPFCFYTNGLEIFFWDLDNYPPRKVVGFPTRDDLERFQYIREHRKHLADELINTEIAGRDYQIRAIRAVMEGIENKRRNFLLVMATGTGKTRTCIALVDALMRAGHAERVLFLVDRVALREQGLSAFKEHLPNEPRWPKVGEKLISKDRRIYISTYPTMLNIIREEGYTLSPHFFDMIVIDETHRAGGETYQRILNHFKPNFLLGMTATPERTDGFDIFNQFDYNIAYEIRLQQALDEEMLSPFHYYGITDITIDGVVNDQDMASDAGFLRLTSKERIDHIIEKSNQYGTDDGNMRCLVFCNSNKVSAALANAFVAKGLKAIALSGDSTENERETAIVRLESDNPTYQLNYIFTVDIFNEGVDIPRVNQIIMLRPTQSAIVFVQQLGRGLRKTEGKEYLTVIDFIGNYQNNFLVPIALYGDHTYNKDSLRKLIAAESELIPGASTVNFDRIAKERIYAAIDSAMMNAKKDLVSDYQLLKYKLGKMPSMMDFVEHGSRDPFLYADYSGSYYAFVAGIEIDFKETKALGNQHMHLLSLITKELANGKRVEEAMLLLQLMTHGPLSQQDFKEIVYGQYGYWPSDRTLESALNNINFGFVTENATGADGKQRKVKVGDKYNYGLVELRYGDYVGSGLWQSLMDHVGFCECLRDVLVCGINRFSEGFDLGDWVDGFVLYRKYSRKDVFRILNWEENPVAQNVGGYMVHPQRHDCAAFVNYHKDDGISVTTQYEDRFVDRGHFDWMSKSKRSESSPDVVAITGHVALGMRIPLFVKKHNDEGQDFYFIGDLEHLPGKVEPVTMADGKTKAVRMGFKLQQPVEAGLYRYLTEKG